MSINATIALKSIPAFAVTNYKGGDGYLVVAIKALRNLYTDESQMGVCYYYSPTMLHHDTLSDYWLAIYRCSDGVMLACSHDFFSKLQSVIRPLGGLGDGL